MPRSSLGPHGSPRTTAYTRSQSFGSMRTRATACCPVLDSSPKYVHVLPASTER
jgi:hypothetical protein